MSAFPKTSIVPPGGFHFIDRSTGASVRIEGTSFEDVAEQVLKFRLSNAKDPGNPSEELAEYICGSWPHFCTDLSPRSPETATAVKPSRHLSSRVAAWFSTFYAIARADRGASQSESIRRAEICATCPQNKEFRDGGCGSCIETVNRLFFVWRRDREVPYEKQLGGCQVTGQHNGAAVLAAELPPLTPEVKVRLPERCWRNKERPLE